MTQPVLFTVKPGGWHRDRNARLGVKADSYTKLEAGTLYIVGKTYTFAPIKIEKGGITGNTSDTDLKNNGNWKITYTLVDAPSGLLIDPADGFIQGVPTGKASVAMKVYAIDGSGT